MLMLRFLHGAYGALHLTLGLLGLLDQEFCVSALNWLDIDYKDTDGLPNKGVLTLAQAFGLVYLTVGMCALLFFASCCVLMF